MNTKPDNHKIPELSWTKADYLSASIDVPVSLLDDDLHTEGELMTEPEIITWILDTQKTFIIIKQENPEIFEKLYQKYVVDIHYLCELGKIDSKDEDDLIDRRQYEI